MWNRSYRAHFSHAAETSNNVPTVSRTQRRVIRRTRRGAAGAVFRLGLDTLFKRPHGRSLAGEKAGMRLPKQYRHMTFDEFVAAAKQALKQLQGRLDRRGRLPG